MSENPEEEWGPPPPDSGSGGAEEEGAPTWIVTFADMMSLLLTFFILMYSMSEVKVDRFLLASESLREAMGSTASVPTENPMGLMPDEVDPDLELSNPGLTEGATDALVDAEGEDDDYIDVFAEAYMKMIEERLQALIDASGLEASAVEIVTEEEGVYLRIRDAALFPSGQARLLSKSHELIVALAGVTAELGVPTIVSGHADSRPISTRAFPSNWELSAARAAGVARLMVPSGQDPETVRVQSFGEFRPVADNETAEGRARNRRVEVFFSRDEIRKVALQLQLEGDASRLPPMDSLSAPSADSLAASPPDSVAPAQGL